MPTKELEIAAYVPSWIKQPKNQVVEEFASYCMEAKRLPDPYFFIVTPQGKLFSPSKDDFVENSIETESRVGKLEKQAFEKIEKWVAEKQEGTIAWISPPLPGRYPVSKIIVSELIKDRGTRFLFNRAVVLELSADECLRLGVRLSRESQIFTDPDDLRSSPIVISPLPGLHWTYLFEEFLNAPGTWKMIKEEDDIKTKTKVLKTVRKIIDEEFSHQTRPSPLLGRILAQRAYETDILGNSPVSCPPALFPTAFRFFFERAYQIIESSFPCPKCERPIPSGKGIIVCPHCGAKKEDHKTCI